MIHNCLEDEFATGENFQKREETKSDNAGKYIFIRSIHMERAQRGVCPATLQNENEKGGNLLNKVLALISQSKSYNKFSLIFRIMWYYVCI